MIQKCKRLADSGEIEDPIDVLRNLCLARGYSGFLGLGRHFREISSSYDDKLNLNQFTRALHDAGFELDNDQAEEIFNRFDFNDDGTIQISNLIAAIRVRKM